MDEQKKLKAEAAMALNGFAEPLLEWLIAEYGEKIALKLLGWIMRKRSQSALPVAMFPDSTAVLAWVLKLIRDHKGELMQLLNGAFDDAMNRLEDKLLNREST